MTVLHLLGADEDTGGILSVLRNLQGATAAMGIRHTVWVNHAYKETRNPPLHYRYSRHLLAESPKHVSLLVRALASAPELLKLQREEKFDVLHAHSRGAFPLVALLALAGTEVVFTNHAYARRTGMYRSAAKLRHFHFVCLTPNMARHYGLAAGTQRVHMISACCSDRFFDLPICARRPVTHGTETTVRLVGLGNIVRWKGWHLVLEAMGVLEAEERGRIEFDHWGPTPCDGESQDYRAELEEHVHRLKLGLRCRFRGPLQNVEQALSQADWFVIPSTNEPCSVALIEALAMGVPAIASASGGNVDIVEPERSGLLFEPGDAVSLAKCLRRILGGKVQMESGEYLRESVRHRSAASVGARYVELYRLVTKVQRRDSTAPRPGAI